MKNSTIVAIVGSIALAFLVFSQASADFVEKSFTVKEGGTFYLDTDSGSIEVVSHDEDTVDIEVEKKGRNQDKFEVTFTQRGNDVKVVGDKKGMSLFSFGPSGAHFTVRVPKDYNVDLRTSGGSIKLSSLRGKVDAYTSGGSIRLGKIQGNVDVKTSGGSIKVDDVAGRINAHTSGGSINVSLSQQPEEDSKLTTSGGSITAYLAPSIAVDLYAKTSGGSVSSKFKVNGSSKRSKIEGEINGGGPKLYLKTSGGSVRVKKL